jgi:hypothetical protein
MTTTTITAGIEFYLPTDAPHWIPNGFATADLQIPADIVEVSEDWYDAIGAAAENWCDENKVLFSQIILEP